MLSDTHDRSIQRKADLREADLCFIDIETTGSVFGYHEIIDIGVVKTSAGAEMVITEWRQKVRPLHPDRITPRALELNQFDTTQWSDAPSPSTALWEEFNELTKGCVAVCHNPSFERAFISMASGKFGVSELGLDYHWIGTESLAWPLYMRGLVAGLSLGELLKYFGLPEEPLPHTAIRGARACLEVYKRLLASR